MVRNRYRVVRRLGTGGMGTVYEVEDALEGGARLALKALWADADDDGLVASLRAEFRVLATLRHPALCRVRDFGRLPPDAGLDPETEGGRGYFFTRELVPGVPLADDAAASGRDLARIARSCADAARGLDVLHRAGMRHGDFKPSNAIVEPRRCANDPGGRVRLIDFGLTARETDRLRGGTLPYMAPEIARDADVDRRADLYALGVSLYELATGQLPSGARGGSELLRWHIEGARPDLRGARPDAPPALARLVAALIARDPRDRLPSAAEAAAALDAIARGLGAEIEPAAAAPLVLPAIERAAVARLERAFELRRRGERTPAVVEVVGDPGCGRSTALTELAWRAQLSGAEVVRADARGGGRALGALGSAMHQLASLSGRRVPAAPPGSPLRHHAAIAGWLGEIAAMWPIAILIDDFDYADAGSQALVRFLSNGLPPGAPVIVVTSRGIDAAPIPGAQAIEIAPLGVRDVEALVAAAAGRDDHRLARRMHAHTGGNLLHVAHALEALARRRFPPAETLGDLELPPRLEQAVSRELEALSGAERAACEALAVIDRPVSTDVVRAVIGDGASAGGLAAAAERGVVLRDAGGLASAAERGVVLRDAGGLASAAERGILVHDGASWRFARPAMAQVVYRALAPERRRELHGAALRALQDGGDIAGSESDPGELARHQVRSGAPVDVELLARAIRWQRERGDPAAAIALGGEALAAGAALGDALRVELGELARLAGDPARAEPFLQPVAAGKGALAARARLELGRAADAASRTERAEAVWREVIAGDSAELAAEAARELSRLCIRHGRFSDAIAVVDQVLGRVADARAGDQLRAARAYARGVTGHDREAERELDEVAAAARAAKDYELGEAALSYAALLAFRAGNYLRAGALYRDSIEAAEAVGDVLRAAILRLNLAALTFLLGDYAASFSHHASAIGVLGAAGAATNCAIARKNFGQLLIELGDLEQAKAELDGAREAAVALGLTVHEIGIEALLGIAAWREGDRAAGRHLLERAGQRFSELGDARKLSDNLLDQAELELEVAVDDPTAAADFLERADQVAATRDDRARRARYLALAADLASLTHDAARARELLAALDPVIGELRAQGARHLLWDLHRIAAGAHERIGDADAARGHAESARGFLSEMARGLTGAQRISFWRDHRRRDLRGGATTTQLGRAPTAAEPLHAAPPFRLLDVYRRLASEHDVQRLLELAMDTAIELTSARRGFLLVAHADGQLETAIARNLPAAALGAFAELDSDKSGTGTRQIPYSRSIAQRVYETGEPVITLDASRDPRFDLARSVHALHIERVLCIPVHARGRVAGVLYLEGNIGRAAAEDPQLLMAFGDQVAVLLEGAQLREELSRRAEQLATARAEIEALLAERTELLERRTDELAIARRDLATVSRKFLGAAGAFGLVGRSAAMERVFALIERAAATDVPVLILGESGTGKELVARALHHHGARREAPMIAVNCGGVAESLLESELFGHVRGAFTGADRTRRGVFEAAGGGTLLLDEIGETSPKMQGALLRALQERVIRRVGDTRHIAVDARIVAATNRPLEKLVDAGQFRQDLYYRLHVVPIEVPPLRERRDDIPLLCDHFLGAIAERTGVARKHIARRAMTMLVEQTWPGNVRQLEHALTNACVLAAGDVLDLPDFEAIASRSERAAPGASGPATRRERERERIKQALDACGGNRSQAARLLEMPRRTFYRRLADHDIA